MRIFLERTNARLAAERATEEEIAQLMDCLEELEQKLSSRDGRMLYRIDHTFHRLIAKMTGNHWMYRQTDLVLDNYLRFEIKSVYDNSIDANIVLEEHQAIGFAIRDKNPDKAERAMKRHLNNSYNRTLGKLWKNEES